MPKRKKDDFETLLKGILKGILLAQKLRKSADKPLSQPSYSHSNTIYEIQLQKTKVLRMQPRHQETLTQPLQCDLQKNYAQWRRKLQLQNRMDPDIKAKKKPILKHFLKGIVKGKLLAPKLKKSADKSLSQP